jgi:hypothetical protein
VAQLRCAECGSIARLGATVCARDGSPLVSVSDLTSEAALELGAAEADFGRCSDCHKSLRPNENPCGRCGTPRRLPPTLLEHAQPTEASPPLASGGDPWANESIAVRLAVSSPHGEARIVTVYSGDAIQVGRSVGPFTDLAGDNISGEHALISVGECGVHVTDLGSDGRGSTNGTYIDGRRIPPNDPVAVEDGATITCAKDPPLTIYVEIES